MPFAQVMRSGSQVPSLAREPRARPAEARDDLVGDEEHARVAADRPRRGQVARWRGEHAAGAQHRLAEERRHARGTGLVDRRAQRVGVIPRHLDDIVQEPPVPVEVRRDARERGPAGVHPVVRPVAADQDRRSGSPASCQNRRAIFTAVSIESEPAAREEDLRPLDGCQRRHPLGERGGRRGRHVAERGVGLELAHLRRDRVGDLGRVRVRRCSTTGSPTHRGTAGPRHPTRGTPRLARRSARPTRRRPRGPRTDARYAPMIRRMFPCRAVHRPRPTRAPGWVADLGRWDHHARVAEALPRTKGVPMGQFDAVLCQPVLAPDLPQVDGDRGRRGHPRRLPQDHLRGRRRVLGGDASADHRGDG